MAFEAVPPRCVGRVGPNGEGRVGERPVRDALVGTGAIAAEARVRVKDGGVDVVARILGLVPPATRTRQ